MTTAILIAMAPAVEGGPAAALPSGDETLIARLARQMHGARVERLVVVTRPGWVDACAAGLEPGTEVRTASTLADALGAIADIASGLDGDLVVADADILTHGSALLGLVADPRTRCGILVGADEDAAGTRRRAWGVRVERGRVVSAASPYHRAAEITARFLGAMRLDNAARARLVVIARAARALLANGVPEGWERELERKASRWGEPSGGAVAVAPRVERARVDAVSILLTGLVRAGVEMRCAYLRQLFWARPLSEPEATAAAAACAAIDEDRLRMDSAVKANDGFFGTFFCSPYTRYIARWADRRGLVPNQVTVFSFALGLSAAACFAVGGRSWLIAGAVLLYFTLAFDCVDGQLARYSKRFTALGAWLDPMFDRGKEYSVYAALAYGGIRHGGDPASLWALAGATMALQTVKHFLDFSYAAGQHRILEALPTSDLAGSDDPRAMGSADDDEVVVAQAVDESAEAHDVPGVTDAPAGTARRAASAILVLSRGANQVGAVVWIKRIIGFPIGERYAAICLTAAIAQPETVFAVMLAWNGFSLAYTGAGRFVRSVTA